jgi:hypothetical protein
MTQVEHLREQAARAERLARHVLDVVTIARLLEASKDYRRQAELLQANSLDHHGTAAPNFAAAHFLNRQ